MRLVFAILAATVLGVQVSASDRPSYEETTGFLASKLNVNSGKYIQRISYQEKCVMKVTYDWKEFDDRGFKFFSTYLVPLAKMDPSETVTVHARENQKVIQNLSLIKFANRRALDSYSGDYGDDKRLSCDGHALECRWEYEHSDYFWFPMILPPESDNRPRVLKAMQHLIKLCGGKEELF